MQNKKQDSKGATFEKKQYYTIEAAMSMLSWSSSDLLERVNAIALSRVVKLARSIYHHRTELQDKYVDEHYKPVSRVTIWRAIDKKKVFDRKRCTSEYVASLIKEAIISGFKEKRLESLSDDQIVIDVYRR